MLAVEVVRIHVSIVKSAAKTKSAFPSTLTPSPRAVKIDAVPNLPHSAYLGVVSGCNGLSGKAGVFYRGRSGDLVSVQE